MKRKRRQCSSGCCSRRFSSHGGSLSPVCVAGEQPIPGPAEERRTILTVFKRDVTVGGTHEQQKYAELVGGEAAGT